ncbi:N(4)-(beta-N-acetylglucosaminyl)-L [Brachionus plicatilis]|uniref:N(4)-(beta-N-acetylglucosaminyl)-L-asparaginase n=1 Tax=Brachionus plicatilis TaxID=10195 RepID=A0A3M7RFD1_BRAPC|nr:N(4)-(beta-N-acetylglucosaminyl)-L [Brachionus plicatilis]
MSGTLGSLFLVLIGSMDLTNGQNIKNNQSFGQSNYPLVINTWPFVKATEKAWQVLEKTDDPLTSVEQGCSVCEELRCDGTVGWGGSPDENGETTLDAMIMDGPSHDAGAVAGLKRIKSAISVARAVMEHTKHTFLVGDAATQFAVEMGFKEQSLSHIDSVDRYLKWLNNSCQPNFRLWVSPDPSLNCGPYQPVQPATNSDKTNANINQQSHDTIGMIAINSDGDMAVGTSTNGAAHKIAGRVGDSPLIGSGAYVDNEVGAACGTGDGDVLMKFLPSYQTVESMRGGKSPSEASEDALRRIVNKYPKFMGAIVAVSKNGDYGAACHGLDEFKFSYGSRKTNGINVESVKCI